MALAKISEIQFIRKMQEFTNKTIDIATLPKFEEVQLTKINSKYFRIILINISIFFLVLLIGFISLSYLNEDLFSNRVWLLIGGFLPFFYGVFLVFYHFSFKKRGYAFREHDVIYKSGLLRESTIIVPNNRVQHVAIHQGFFSRQFGLASVELFTAGGNNSDLEIAGLLLADAQKIKNRISIKINDTIENIEEQNSINEEIVLKEDIEVIVAEQNKQEAQNED